MPLLGFRKVSKKSGRLKKMAVGGGYSHEKTPFSPLAGGHRDDNPVQRSC